MALNEGIEAALAAGPGLAADIDPSRRQEFLDLWREVKQADTRDSEWERNQARLRLTELLEETLPPSHPVLVALYADTATLHGDTLTEPLNAAEVDALIAALEADLAADGSGTRGADVSSGQPADYVDAVVEALRRTARAALLAHPNRDAAQVRAAGVDPYASGLLRLTGPDGEPRLPAFQFGPGGRPLPTVITINELLGADDDPWGVAAWWFDYNGYLADTPVAVLGRLPAEDLIALAHGAVGED